MQSPCFAKISEKLIVCIIATLACSIAFAQDPLNIYNRNGEPARLLPTDIAFAQARIDNLDLGSCSMQPILRLPEVDYRYLESQHAGVTLLMIIEPDAIHTGGFLIVTESGGSLKEYSNCPDNALLPVIALISTVSIRDGNSNQLRQNVFRQNTGLTSYEANQLNTRVDSNDENKFYMDFTVSLKHPVLPQADGINAVYDQITDTLESFIPGDNNEHFMQLYLAFSGRFSQYIGSRLSAPVVSRRFNPSLFYRFWSSPDSYLDIGFGHESNGQQISTEDEFTRASQFYVDNGEPGVYARDALSRGWDYTSMDWRRQWDNGVVSEVKLRHYLSDGPLQGISEEYNTWEDGGNRNRPRSQFDGVSFSLGYQFSANDCLNATLHICLKRFEITQETGYSKAFDNNSTMIKFTTDFFGLPIQIWGKSGYNSDLVDYYDYTNSWGLGLELLSY